MQSSNQSESMHRTKQFIIRSALNHQFHHYHTTVASADHSNHSHNHNHSQSRSTKEQISEQLYELERQAKFDKLYKQLLPVRSFIQLSQTIRRPLIPDTNNTVEHNIMSNNTIIIDGTKTAQKVRNELKEQVDELKKTNSVSPCLAVVLVGERKDSQTYVNMKTKACNECGIIPVQHNVSADITEAELSQLVVQLNNDSSVNGILIQLPLPSHINQFNIIQLIDSNKDVDGLTLISAGQVYSHGMAADLIACTPLGCINLLDEYKINISGANAVVLGRSQLVGKPIASLLLSRNATVTMCHSKTKDMPDVIRRADIVIAAIGKPLYVKRDWLKPGAVVIDVGINAVDDASKKSGYRLVGDVDYDNCKDVCSAITPVPGGVGMES